MNQGIKDTIDRGMAWGRENSVGDNPELKSRSERLGPSEFSRLLFHRSVFEVFDAGGWFDCGIWRSQPAEAPKLLGKSVFNRLLRTAITQVHNAYETDFSSREAFFRGLLDLRWAVRS